MALLESSKQKLWNYQNPPLLGTCANCLLHMIIIYYYYWSTSQWLNRKWSNISVEKSIKCDFKLNSESEKMQHYFNTYSISSFIKLIINFYLFLDFLTLTRFFVSKFSVKCARILAWFLNLRILFFKKTFL